MVGYRFWLFAFYAEVFREGFGGSVTSGTTGSTTSPPDEGKGKTSTSASFSQQSAHEKYAALVAAKSPPERVWTPQPDRFYAELWGRIKTIIGDGDCLFRSVAAALNRLNDRETRIPRTKAKTRPGKQGWDHIRVRDVAVDYMEENKVDFMYFLDGDDEVGGGAGSYPSAAELSRMSEEEQQQEKLKGYLRKMARRSTYGGDPEITALQQAFDINIRVWNRQANLIRDDTGLVRAVHVEERSSNLHDGKPVIHLAFNRLGTHYELVRNDDDGILIFNSDDLRTCRRGFVVRTYLNNTSRPLARTDADFRRLDRSGGEYCPLGDVVDVASIEGSTLHSEISMEDLNAKLRPFTEVSCIKYHSGYYQGQISRDTPHGNGNFVSILQPVSYEGKWKFGKRDGFGTSVTDSHEYTGEWKEDFFHGRGHIVWYTVDESWRKHNLPADWEGLFENGEPKKSRTSEEETSISNVGPSPTVALTAVPSSTNQRLIHSTIVNAGSPRKAFLTTNPLTSNQPMPVSKLTPVADHESASPVAGAELPASTTRADAPVEMTIVEKSVKTFVDTVEKTVTVPVETTIVEKSAKTFVNTVEKTDTVPVERTIVEKFAKTYEDTIEKTDTASVETNIVEKSAKTLVDTVEKSDTVPVGTAIVEKSAETFEETIEKTDTAPVESTIVEKSAKTFVDTVEKTDTASVETNIVEKSAETFEDTIERADTVPVETTIVEKSAKTFVDTVEKTDTAPVGTTIVEKSAETSEDTIEKTDTAPFESTIVEKSAQTFVDTVEKTDTAPVETPIVEKSPETFEHAIEKADFTSVNASTKADEHTLADEMKAVRISDNNNPPVDAIELSIIVSSTTTGPEDPVGISVVYHNSAAAHVSEDNVVPSPFNDSATTSSSEVTDPNRDNSVAAETTLRSRAVFVAVPVTEGHVSGSASSAKHCPSRKEPAFVVVDRSAIDIENAVEKQTAVPCLEGVGAEHASISKPPAGSAFVTTDHTAGKKSRKIASSTVADPTATKAPAAPATAPRAIRASKKEALLLGRKTGATISSFPLGAGLEAIPGARADDFLESETKHGTTPKFEASPKHEAGPKRDESTEAKDSSKGTTATKTLPTEEKVNRIVEDNAAGSGVVMASNAVESESAQNEAVESQRFPIITTASAESSSVERQPMNIIDEQQVPPPFPYEYDEALYIRELSTSISPPEWFLNMYAREERLAKKLVELAVERFPNVFTPEMSQTVTVLADCLTTYTDLRK